MFMDISALFGSGFREMNIFHNSATFLFWFSYAFSRQPFHQFSGLVRKHLILSAFSRNGAPYASLAEYFPLST